MVKVLMQVKKLDCSRLVPAMLLMAVVLAALMSLKSPFNAHPDEYHRFHCAKYYVNNWLPPEIGAPESLKTYTMYGNSRLNELRLDFFLYGKFFKIIAPVIKNELFAFRLFGLSLLLTLALISMRNSTTRILFLPLLISPQIWYVFSYINDDCFPLFLSFVAMYQLVNKNSWFNRFLGSNQVFGFIQGGILFGFILGILSVSKIGYLLFLLFIIFVLLFRLLGKQAAKVKLLLKKYLFVAGTVCLVFSSIYAVHIYVNGFNRADKIAAYKEEVARYECKPSTIKNEHPDKSYYWLGLKGKGVEYRKLFSERRWFRTCWRSFVGGYGYMTVFAGKGYYRAMRWLYLCFAVFVISSILKNSARREKYFMLIVILFVIIMIFCSTYYSWTVDSYTQGKYLFPVLGMVGFLLYRNKDSLNRLIALLFLGLLFLMSAYSFIFVALKNLSVS